MASLNEVGQRLKQAREAQGLSLTEVSARTRITVRHLRALEEGIEADLPEVFYIRGFLKKYAEVVGLSPGDVADAYRSAPVPTAPLPDLRQSSGPWGYYLGIAALLVGLLGLAWYFQPRVSVIEAPQATPMEPALASPAPVATAAIASEALALAPAASGTLAAATAALPVASPASASAAELVQAATPPVAAQAPSPDATATAPVSPAPSVTPTPRPSPTPKRSVAITLALQERSWVEVRVNGTLQIEGVLSRGTMKRFSGREVEVSAGNAGGVLVFRDGKALGPLGSHGAVLTRVYRPTP